jgi:putative DNA primase/helicase
MSSIDRAAEIERLAVLDDTQYETVRNDEATRLGFRAKILDKLREQKRREMKLDPPKADNGGQGRPLQFPELLPWPDEIEGDRVATALSATFKRYVRMSDPQADTCALWVLVDWTLDKFSIAPRLCVTSPTKQCGKSTLLELLGRVCPRSLMSGSVTPAALFRAIEQYRPTLMLDENEKYLEVGSDFHALLNQGHRRGQYVIRTCGDDHELRTFNTFCMVAFARNGRVPDDLEQRSIVIELQRRLRGEALVALTDRCENLHNLARMCLRWAEDYAGEIAGVEPDMDGLINRVADNWRPLFIIAELIGSDWPQRVRDACAALRPKDDADSTDTLLLADIKVVFDDRQADRLWSEQICEALAAMEGHPWAEYGKNAKPISKNQLASRLRRFKADPDGKVPIEPSTVWIGQHSKKGYRRDQFEAAWNRYLTQKPIDPPFEPSGRQTPDAMGTSATFQGVRAETDLTVRKSQKPPSNGRSDGLTVCKGGIKAIDEVCGYCGKPGDLYPVAYGDREATLHAACRDAWVVAQSNSLKNQAGGK